MNRKLNLVALILSIVALVTCLAILLRSYSQGDHEGNLILLILTGVSFGLISVNLANYRRSRRPPP